MRWSVWAGATLVALQAMALLAAAGYLVADAFGVERHHAALPLASAVLTLLTAVFLLVAARGLAHRQVWARTPIGVCEVLVIAIGVGLGRGRLLAVGAGLVVPAVVVLALVAWSARGEAVRRGARHATGPSRSSGS